MFVSLGVDGEWRYSSGSRIDCFQNKVDLITQTFFGIYAVSDPLLYENRVVEGHEGVHQRSGGLRRINTKRACVDPIIYNRLDDRHEMLIMRTDDRPVLCRCGDNQIMNRLLVQEGVFPFPVKLIEKFYQLLVSRPLHLCNRSCRPHCLSDDATTNRRVDRRP